MTDRELLEAAAEAAGVDFIISGGQLWTTMDGSIHKHTERWNPLANDGQALRMAVKLNLMVDCDDRTGMAQVAVPPNWIREPINGDKYAATRRAIVRAAAALTPSMESKEE